MRGECAGLSDARGSLTARHLFGPLSLEPGKVVMESASTAVSCSKFSLNMTLLFRSTCITQKRLEKGFSQSDNLSFSFLTLTAGQFTRLSHITAGARVLSPMGQLPSVLGMESSQVLHSMALIDKDEDGCA